MKPDPSKVPERLRALLPWADEWAIGDDGYRADAIGAASDEALEELVRAFDAITWDDLDWLTTAEAREPARHAEHQALILLEMALHEAVSELKQRRKRRRD